MVIRIRLRSNSHLFLGKIFKEHKIKMMKKVLIALDYDPTAQKIAADGYSLANSMGAEVVLLHVIADGTYYSSLEYKPITGFFGFTETDLSNIVDPDGLRNAVMHFLDKTKKHLADDNIQTVVKEGDFAECILKAAKDMHVDIIVIGSHSRSWLEEILMGSVTEKVLQHTTIPLFIIPTKKQK